MKIIILADEKRYRKFMPENDFVKKAETVFLSRDAKASDIPEHDTDAEVIFADAISKVDSDIIDRLPGLKLIHSEGVAFDKIDIKYAAEKGVYVCNNKGANAGAVAEQAICLMLGLLRTAVTGDAAVRAGNQIKMKETRMLQGITELGECSIGLVGLGDIAVETAKRLKAFGCDIYYWNRKEKPDLARSLGIKYLPLEELAKKCDIISLHLAVAPETIGIINEEFFSKMKNTSYIINTARGDLIDNTSLRNALTDGRIAGAGIDTLFPEPVQADNPVVDLPEEVKYKVFFSPHLGGITTGTFRRCHAHMWQNAERISKCEKPDNIVNL